MGIMENGFLRILEKKDYFLKELHRDHTEVKSRS